MDAASSAAASWARSIVRPTPRQLPKVVLLAGINRSDIVEAALADTTHCGSTVVRFDPACSAPCDANLWRLETAYGESLNTDGLLDRVRFRPPYALTVRLLHYRPGSSQPEILDEGTIGTRVSRHALQTNIDRIAMRFVRDALRDRNRGPSGTPSADPPHGRPGWVNQLAFRWHDRVMTEWWSLGVSNADLRDVLSGDGLDKIHWFNPDAGQCYLADPFPWPGSDKILCEEMPLDGGPGRIIAVSEDDGRLTRRQTILDDGDHHSYPSTLRQNGRVYCVPESTERGATRIHELHPNGSMSPVCTVAPHARIADPTLFRYASRIWIACTDLELGHHDNLCLLHAADISGPWIPHAKWPVRIDIRGARPAGSVFECDGRLIRPGQDCAASYGAAVALHEIDTLTEADFSETFLTVLRPDPSGPFPHGLHTLVHDGKRIWVDGKRFVFAPYLVRQKVLARLPRVSRRIRGV